MLKGLLLKGYSSVGRTLVSKTKCRGFESFCPCEAGIFIPAFYFAFLAAVRWRVRAYISLDADNPQMLDVEFE